ncbi:hypothetical protein F4561_006559 [Lipingzhangella halophila]|uniref:Uncharacterized protein n=1 Tax=Lipingzhangella halophila TaxID=1783352 RepID=A0A7W7RP85_9ACTN|nr:hypothetical protein [Lipingzhangella halophila]MBB4935650.1 hypothetical protein [Lipingzhangella halophila]
MTSVGVPSRLMPHTVTLVHPVESTDSYGNTVYDYGEAAERSEVRAWLQQDQRSLVAVDGADPMEARWLMVTDHTGVRRRDRVEWDDHPSGEQVVFRLDGQPAPLYNPLSRNGVHHMEVTLRVVDG